MRQYDIRALWLVLAIISISCICVCCDKYNYNSFGHDFDKIHKYTPLVMDPNSSSKYFIDVTVTDSLKTNTEFSIAAKTLTFLTESHISTETHISTNQILDNSLDAMLNMTEKLTYFSSALNLNFDIKFSNQSKAIETKDVYPQGILHVGDSTNWTKDNCYILKFKCNIDIETLYLVNELLCSIGAQIRLELENSIKGLIVCFPKNFLPLQILKSIPHVVLIERDQSYSALQTQHYAPWGLSRISHKNQPSKMKYKFNLSGENVTVYVIDSGVMINHPEFSGRASLGFSKFNGSIGSDCSGHGTEVASVIAGVNVGVAKRAKIIAVQVLDCQGQGQNSDLIVALDWIFKNGHSPAIINMSVGGPFSPILDEAVQAAINRGFTVVVAAGNSAIDACKMSPSSVKGAIVVASTNEHDNRAKFSNFGRCVTLFAPGTGILAATIPGKKKKQSIYQGYDLVSGTSLSCPFASGVAALLLEQHPNVQPSYILNQMLIISAVGVLNDTSLMSSSNRLLQVPKSIGLDRQLIDTFFLDGQSFDIDEKKRIAKMEFFLTLLSGIFILIAIIIAVVDNFSS